LKQLFLQAFFAAFLVAVPAALLAAHLLRNASESRFLPSAVNPPFRFAFAGAGEPPVPAFRAAQRAFRASESLRRPSGVIPPLRLPLRPLATAGAAGALALAPVSPTSRKAASALSMALPCCSSCLIISANPFVIVFSSFVSVDSKQSTPRMIPRYNAISYKNLPKTLSMSPNCRLPDKQPKE
jgi:hypothetical protein